MVVIEGAILDYNATTARGYHEISAGYAFLARAVRGFRAARAYKLLVPLQVKCWKLTLSGDLDKVVNVFSTYVLRGERADYVEKFARSFDIHDSPFKWAVNLPKLGKKIDTSLIPGAIDFARAAHDADKKTAIYSCSFVPFIVGNLQRHGYLELFDEVEGNEWKVEDGIITGWNEKVDCTEKGRGFRDFLQKMELRTTGEGVAYWGDNEQDVSVFRLVEHPNVAPTAKDEFKERCRSDREFGHRVQILPWEDHLKYYNLNGK